MALCSAARATRTNKSSDRTGAIPSFSFSFPGKVSADLVYINAEGESLSAAELMKDLSEEKIETYSDIANITFDQNGYIVELDFSE